MERTVQPPGMALQRKVKDQKGECRIALKTIKDEADPLLCLTRVRKGRVDPDPGGKVKVKVQKKRNPQKN